MFLEEFGGFVITRAATDAGTHIFHQKLRAFASLAWLNIQNAMQDNLALLPYKRNK